MAEQSHKAMTLYDSSAEKYAKNIIHFHPKAPIL